MSMTDRIDPLKVDHKILTGDLTTQEKKDLELNKVIKPKLRKYLINKQRKQAQVTSTEQKKEKDELVSREDVIKQASRMSMRAFLDIRIWEKAPPLIEMKWLVSRGTSPELQKEMQGDIAGFSSFLVREYYQYQRLRSGTTKGYPNPFIEENLMFFWKKFNVDVALLIKADSNRVKAGNAGIVLASNLPSVRKLN